MCTKTAKPRPRGEMSDKDVATHSMHARSLTHTGLVPAGVATRKLFNVELDREADELSNEVEGTGDVGAGVVGFVGAGFVGAGVKRGLCPFIIIIILGSPSVDGRPWLNYTSDHLRATCLQTSPTCFERQRDATTPATRPVHPKGDRRPWQVSGGRARRGCILVGSPVAADAAGFHAFQSAGPDVSQRRTTLAGMHLLASVGPIDQLR